MGYETLARVSLATLPTPLEELAGLRKKIGGPRIFMKRDDLTGLALGGNKLRKLEFLLGDALQKGADVVVTSGSLQTNHGRLTAAACAKLGLECYLVLTEEDDGRYQGNRVIEYFCGAHEVFAPFDKKVEPARRAKEQLRAGDACIKALVQSLVARGKTPYVIPRGGRSLYGTASYCAAMAELALQCGERGLLPTTLFVPCATSSTMTGISLGNRAAGINARVLGVALSRSAEEGKSMLAEEFNHDAEAMGYPYRIQQAEVEILGGYIGEGYGNPTPAGMEAMRLLACSEGILLDPVYTGKTMAAYIDLVQRGFFSGEETVVFFHTGGTPLLFLNSVEEWIQQDKQAKQGG